MERLTYLLLEQELAVRLWGTASYLKEKNVDIKTVIVEPEGSILNGGKAGSHETEGIGLEFIPPFLKTSYFDEIHTISDQNAFLRVKELAQKRRTSCWELFRSRHFMQVYLKQRKRRQVQIL